MRLSKFGLPDGHILLASKLPATGYLFISQGKNMSTLLKEIKLWIKAIRFYAHSASMLPVVIGAAYAWVVTEQFYWGRFWISLLAAILYQSGCNLINDYYDTKYGLDREDTYGGSKVLLRGEMSYRKMMTGIVILLILGTLLGLWLLQYGGWILLALGVGGLLSLIFYTASRKNAKYNAMGEPLVFVSMGVAMTLGGYVVQTGTVTWNAVWISLPISFLVTAILQANDMRDLADDRASGIVTISILVGPDGARRFYDMLLFSPFIALPLLVIARIAPWPILIALATLPLAIKIHREIWRYRGEKQVELRDAPVIASMLHMGFNVLMSAGLVAGPWFPTP